MTIPVEIRARRRGVLRAHLPAGGGAVIAGRAIPYGEWSDDLGGFREMISPGAFRESLADDDIRCLYNHNPDIVLGRKSTGTLRLTESDRGVDYDVDINPDDHAAMSAVARIRRGDIDGNSFGFWVENREDESWEEKDGTLWRTVKRARLGELGPQAFPAYPQSDVQVRSLKDILEEGRRCVGSACRRRGGGADPDVLLRELEFDRGLRERRDEQQRAKMGPTRHPHERSDPPTRHSDWPVLVRQGGERLRAMAVHEAGHALIFVLHGVPLEDVFLAHGPDGYHGRCGIGAASRYPAEGFAAGALAAQMAGFGSDVVPMSSADRQGFEMHSLWGAEFEHARRAREQLRFHWCAVVAVSRALLERQILSGSEAEALIMRHLDLRTRETVMRQRKWNRVAA